MIRIRFPLEAGTPAVVLVALLAAADLTRFEEPMVVALLHAFAPARPPDFDLTLIQSRVGHYRFDVESDLAANSGDAGGSIVSPKASILYAPSGSTELYLSGGLGFHSNDARGTVQAMDPISGDLVDPVDPLVRSSRRPRRAR